MKVVFTTIPATGHFEPLLPLAQAMVAAGHEVVFATAPGFHDEIRAKGFAARSAGLELEAMIAASDGKGPGGTLTPAQRAGKMFARIAPRAMLPDLLEIGREWRPDVLVHEEGEYAAPLAAQKLGIPNVGVGVSAPLRPPQQLDMLDGILSEFWIEADEKPQPYGGVFRTLFLDPCPPALQSEFGLDLPTSHRIRPAVPEAAPSAALPEWCKGMPDNPIVHVTFGTVAVYNDAPEIYRTIIDGLGDEAINLVITVGKTVDPNDLGSARENVRLERFIPHAELLPHCDAVVTHGGPGSTVAALAHGLPLVLIPGGGASQHRTAQACERAGVGRTILRDEVTATSVAGTILDVLHKSRFRERAVSLAAEIGDMPPPADAVRAIEALTAQR